MVLVPDQTIHPTHTVPATQSAGPKPVSAKTSPATWAMGSRWPLEVAASAAAQGDLLARVQVQDADGHDHDGKRDAEAAVAETVEPGGVARARNLERAVRGEEWGSLIGGSD